MGVGGAFESGGVAAFGADFAIDGFAGPGAGAVFAGDLRAGGRLGPMLRFFHRITLGRRAVLERRGLHPMETRKRGGQLAVAMKLPNDQHEGAGAKNGAARGNEMEEALFGDERWIEERLRALQVPIGAALDDAA